ncbi:uncharacterized protein LOC111878782 [Lactuca sativa]|uniref:uncharacterized protein LOC111878782 n=1 Tax=Lactuca sativa TaxID=4236 RepID=UPI000CD99EA9|nr:uncharacterized protein LOC111878782 [Lactuca sativa]
MSKVRCFSMQFCILIKVNRKILSNVISIYVIQWSNFLDYEGLVMDPNALKKRIFFGEVEYSLRKEVWEFLLGSYLYDSTYAERWYIVSVKTSEYMTFKKINGRSVISSL